MAEPAQILEFGGGDGGGDGFDPRDFAIMCLQHQNAEFRTVMRALLDADGPEAAKAIADAERLLDGLDTIDAEDEGEAEMLRYFNSPLCDMCGALKGIGTSYCPECDKEALAKLGVGDRLEAAASNDG